ncbi:MAG TPA: hypothetical protein V6D06_19110 [Trichocoleus sp.]
MIHHISIAAKSPRRVASVLAEIWRGKVMPVPSRPGSFVALPLDAVGTMIEVHPLGTELVPGCDDSDGMQFRKTPHPSSYSATRVTVSVTLGEATIFAIAHREGWRAIRSSRSGYYDVIELWLENHILIEVVSAESAQRYLDFMNPWALNEVLDGYSAA